MPANTDVRFPIGPFTPPAEPRHVETLSRLAVQIGELPARLRRALDGLTREQLDTPYREHGWTVRQVVHHLADSHMHAFLRFKLGLTADTPRINPYDENRWAALPDARLDPAVSVQIIDGIHQRWATLIPALTAADFAREYDHPVNGRTALHEAVAMYDWHGRHHVGHITALRERRGW